MVKKFEQAVPGRQSPARRARRYLPRPVAIAAAPLDSDGLAPAAGRAGEEQAPPPAVVRPGAGWDGGSPREAVPGARAGEGGAGARPCGESGSVNARGTALLPP